MTAGLESMIVGEAEIQGQVRRAHEAAMRAGSTGALSNRLFAAALTTGKRVRTETGIGSSRVSVPSVAVDLALSVLGGLEERHVVILGAGETSELTARALAEQGAGTIFVANRHADRALSLAQRFGGSVVGLDGLPEQLLHADIVLSSTSSPHPIVGREELELVMARARRAGALLLIDIAVPRDIDAGCGELDGVTLYDIDDLQAVVARNLDTRASEIPRAEEIVEEEIQRFARWLGQLEVLPTVSALREHGNALVEQVLAENSGRWEAASPRDLARIEAVARAVMSRLLHEPTIRLRSLSEERGHASLELVRELFGLRDDEPAESADRGRGASSDRARPARRGPRPPAPPPGLRRLPAMPARAAARALMRIGTRGSALGARAGGTSRERWRADARARRARATTTSGRARDHDQRRQRELAAPAGGAPADKSRWVDTIEAALLAGEIDLAVHSAKDVPGELAEGLALLGAPARVAAEDVLCGATLWSRSPRARAWGRAACAEPRNCGPRARTCGWSRSAATSTRACAGSARRMDLDAIVLAHAGLLRLDRAAEVGAVLDPARFVPAPGQGALALEGRAGDARVRGGGARDRRRGRLRLPARRARRRARAGRELPHAARAPMRCPPAVAA